MVEGSVVLRETHAKVDRGRGVLRMLRCADNMIAYEYHYCVLVLYHDYCCACCLPQMYVPQGPAGALDLLRRLETTPKQLQLLFHLHRGTE